MTATIGATRLLLDEQPLLVRPSLAMAIGLNEAIVLQQIYLLLTREGESRDGRLWVPMPGGRMRALFPFWSVDTVRRTLGDLYRIGVILSRVFESGGPKYVGINHDRLNEILATEVDAIIDDPNPMAQIQATPLQSAHSWQDAGGMQIAEGGQDAGGMQIAEGAICLEVENAPETGENPTPMQSAHGADCRGARARGTESSPGSLRDPESPDPDQESSASLQTLVATPEQPAYGQTAQGHERTPRRKTRRDHIWDALIAGGCASPVTDSERSNFGKIVGKLDKIEASPAEILRRCQAFKTGWTGLTLTPNAVERHWSTLGQMAETQAAAIESPATTERSVYAYPKGIAPVVTTEYVLAYKAKQAAERAAQGAGLPGVPGQRVAREAG